MTPEIVSVAGTIAAELTADGAKAVVLAGSQVRGDATELSDIDLYAIGEGPTYSLRVIGGHLVAVSWRSEDDERRAMREPATAGTLVPAWRSARVLHDPSGIGGALQREAAAFDWAAISAACDEWVAEATVGYAEEVLKLVAARRAGDRLLAAVQRSVLALRLPRVMAVHQRLLYDTENRLWRLVAQAMGKRWASAQATALGLTPGKDAGRAALTLFTLAVEEVGPLLSPSQIEVADLAMRVVAEETDGVARAPDRPEP